ncbi:unnamed protein product, partial [Prorocentrum cordatum]
MADRRGYTPLARHESQEIELATDDEGGPRDLLGFEGAALRSAGRPTCAALSVAGVPLAASLVALLLLAHRLQPDSAGRRADHAARGAPEAAAPLGATRPVAAPAAGASPAAGTGRSAGRAGRRDGHGRAAASHSSSTTSITSSRSASTTSTSTTTSVPVRLWNPSATSTTTTSSAARRQPELAHGTPRGGAEAGAERHTALPSLFCFLVMMAGSGEQELVVSQLEREGGIFGCESRTVFSDQEVLLRAGQLQVLTRAVAMPSSEVGDTAKPGQTTSSWLNAATFEQVWRGVRGDGSFKSHAWTAKLDPDTVFFPERLRRRLARVDGAGSAGLYLLNCPRLGGMLFGGIEVLSRRAVELFLEGEALCRSELDWSGWGEDWFLQKCLDWLWVGHVADFGLLADARGHCTFGAPAGCDSAE